MKQLLKRWMLVPFLLTSVLSSGGCSNQTNAHDPTWVRPIYFSPQTTEWLEGLEWPPSAYDDFEQIARHNLKYELIHQNTPRPTH